MLTATRHHLAPDVIVVTTSERDEAHGNVVARFNERHDVLTRSHYDGPRPSLRDIRAAIAAVTTNAPLT